MTDRYGNPTSPADSAVDVTPSDTTLLSRTKGLYVGVTGTLVVVFPDDQPGTSHTFVTCLGGSIYPFAVTQVLAATSATGIIALY
jgi:hypothetical protein